MKWWPIIIQSPAEGDLVAAELYTKRQEKAMLEDNENSQY